MPIRDNDPRPAYEQLADELRQAIAAGDYQPGDRLPSTRELSEAHGIAPMTVRNALRRLEDEHLVVARQGRGVFVQAPVEPAGSDPLTALQASLDANLKALEQISQRLDRYDAERQARPRTEPTPAESQRSGVEPEPADASSQTPPGQDTQPAASSRFDDNLNAALADLRATQAALDEAAASGPDVYDPGPEPDHGPDLGL
jgi:DNA-binding transcriptional regulator YhcF (GntR family)